MNDFDKCLYARLEVLRSEPMVDCIDNLFRQAARGEEWATKMLCERLEAIQNAHPKE
jgi:hypothetical protein